MKKIVFRKELVSARIRNPLKNFDTTEENIEIRWDPLLNYSSRITRPKGLDKVPEGKPLLEYAASQSSCFFCRDRVEKSTPKLPEDIEPAGRLKAGEAILFPNLSGFGAYSAVCIFSGEHFIPPEKFTIDLIRDAFTACRDYFRKCTAADNRILYPSVNWNYFLPSGSSILHPHLQPFLDPFPTNFHGNLLSASKSYFENNAQTYWKSLMETEKDGDRYLFETVNCFLYSPFAPLGFNEINGIFKTDTGFTDFTCDLLNDLASCLHRIMQFYHKIEHNSFNFTLFSPPVPPADKSGFQCQFRICTRPVFAAYYRNDVTFFEKFHLENMLDQPPEETVKLFRSTSD
ncbi:MAG: hypothetical protein EH225_05245 [Calditrichaeota bacterium]|nr:hypothetical protein [Calditrichota bacterium]RQW04880.1 MAG: hypothetical protein EH225_05245 [Calditrichota bacterium]